MRPGVAVPVLAFPSPYSGFDGLGDGAVRLQIIAAHDNIESGLPPGGCGRHVDLGTLEDDAGRSQGQRGLVDRRRRGTGLWSALLPRGQTPLAKRAASPLPVL